MLKNTVQISCFLLGAFIVGIMGYYAFVTVDCLAYPWWVGLGSDGDGTYVTQTLLLLNNGPLQLVFHPGATVYGMVGIVLRIVDVFDPSHAFLSLAQMSNPVQVFEMLNRAMSVSRGVIILLNVLTLLLCWRVLYQLCKDVFVSLGLAGVFMTAYFMMDQRLFVIRPELTSFFFCAAMFSWLLSIKGRSDLDRPIGMGGMVLVGLFAGLAVLAKIQVLVLVGVLAMGWFWGNSYHPGNDAPLRAARMAVIVAVINLLLMPWGWLKRPGFLLEYLKGLYYAREEHRMYGPAPQNAGDVYLVVLGALAVLSIALLFWRHRQQARIAGVMLRINCFITGGIISCYLVFAGVCRSWESYWAASNHLLYALTTNILFGGAANHRVVDADTWKAIIELHSTNHILGVGILWYVAAAAGLCVFRLASDAADRSIYRMVLFLFFLALGNDILSSFRQYFPNKVMIISSYAIYSLPVYLCGLALLLKAELAQIKISRMRVLAQSVIGCWLALHMVMIAFYVGRMPKWDVAHNRGQTPDQEMQNTLSAVPGFWHMASQGRI